MLESRHEGHHNRSVTYGYVVLFLSSIHAGLLVWSTYHTIKQWRRTGRLFAPNSKNISALVSRAPVAAVVCVWCCIAVTTSVWYVNLPTDYVLTVKRLGRIAYVMVALDIFLVLRPPGTIFNYLDTLALHKWVSRLIVALSFAHGAGYSVYWFRTGGLSRYVTTLIKWENMLGACMLALVLAITIISLRWFRRKIYKWFYVVHTVGVWVFVAAIALHARPAVWVFTFIIFGLLAVQVYLKISLQIAIDQLTVIEHSASSSFTGAALGSSGTSNLVVVRIPKIYFPPWTPASHIRVSHSGWVDTYIYPSHPYTIASTIDDATVDLVVLKTPGFQFNPNIQQSYVMSGPYPSLPEPFFTTTERVSIICGGSGISYGLPILKGINSNAEMDIFWCVRNKEDLFILKTLEFRENITVYLTRQGDNLDNSVEESDGLLNGQETSEADFSVNDVELESLSGVADSKDSNITIRHGRPNYDEIFSPLTLRENKANTWLIACGPEGFVNSCKKWSSDHDVPFLSELYEF